jgi:hypothetical protein
MAPFCFNMADGRIFEYLNYLTFSAIMFQYGRRAQFLNYVTFSAILYEYGGRAQCLNF